MIKGKLAQFFALYRDRGAQKRYFKWIIANSRPYLGTLIFFLSVDTAGVAISMGSALISKNVVDAASGGGEFTRGFIIMVLIAAANMGLNAVSSLISTVLSERYSFGIRLGIYDKLLRSDWLRLSGYHSGDLLTRFTSDIDTVTGGISSIFPGFVTLSVRLVSAFCILFYYAKPLALFALLLGPAGVLLTLVFGGTLKKLSVKVKESEANYRSFVQESISNVTAIKAFRDEARSEARLTMLRNERLAVILKRNRLNVFMSASIGAVYAFGYLFAFAYSIYGLSDGSITFGTMTLMLTLVSQIQSPIMSLAGMIPRFIEVLASAGRIMEIEELGAEPDLGGVDTYEAVGIRFTYVSFSYTAGDVLRGVNLDVSPGTSLGIVGVSGAGKTTLIRLALALIMPQSGTVEFYHDGGCEPANAATRRHIAYVPQGSTLVSGTVADNLREGKADATEEEMWDALERAEAAEFVRASKLGLESVMRERAGGFSEGQAQRIAIARALIKGAPVLILDEATAALDAETERRILSRLAEAEHRPTCLIITHRRQMLRYCDRAVEIEDGMLREITNKE